MEDYLFKDREQLVNDLQNYLRECQDEVNTILEAVGWTPDHFIQQEDIVSCSFDSSHRMPKKYLAKHEEKCELLFVGYKKEDLKDVIHYSQLFADNPPSGSTVSIDKETMNRVLRDHHVQNHSLFFAQEKVPLTPDEFTIQLTPSERAAIYDYVAQKVKNEKKLTEQETDSFLSTDLQEIVKQRDLGDKDKPKSYLDYLAAQRDYKRRRQSYRAKNVHITKKSYTEIIREVIENQTEYLSLVRKEEEENIQSKQEELQKDLDYHPVGDDKHDEFIEDHYKERDKSIEDQNIEDSYKGRDKSTEDSYRGRDKSKKKKKHKKHKHKHRHRSSSRSESRSRSRSKSRY